MTGLHDLKTCANQTSANYPSQLCRFHLGWLNCEGAFPGTWNIQLLNIREIWAHQCRRRNVNISVS